MFVNSSSFSDIVHPNHSSITTYLVFTNCLFSKTSSSLYVAYFITNILVLLPLCISILYLRLQQWRQHHSTSAATMTSHSDSVVYHLVTMQLIRVFGIILCCFGVYKVDADLLSAGYILWAFTWYGEMFFHILACVGRYMAVVHPVTYMRLKSERGVRIRNVCNGCVWLICTGAISLRTFVKASNSLDVFLLTFSLIVIIFCSLSVLCVLIRPGPGEQGGKRRRVDQTKQRASYTVVAILGVLLLKLVWNLIWASLLMSGGDLCMIMAIGMWLNLPSTVVLPLLFLPRVGKCGCFRKTT